MITDKFDVEIGRFSFNPFGRRRQPDWLTGPPSQPIATTRGYTGHEHDDDLELVNMNARIYEPILGRFLTPDPIIPDIYDPQSLNRYSYVKNNPLSATDSTGFFAEDITSDDIEITGCDDCNADLLLSDIDTALSETLAGSDIDDGIFADEEIELAGGPAAAVLCNANPLCWMGVGVGMGIMIGNSPDIPLTIIPINDPDITVSIPTEIVPAKDTPIPVPHDPTVSNPSIHTPPPTSMDKLITNGLRVNSESRGYDRPSTEIKSGIAVKPEEAMDRWDEFLGPNQTNIDPRDGQPDPDRIWSDDGERSIRYGEHEMDSSPNKQHYHEETWYPDRVENVLQRIPDRTRK